MKIKRYASILCVIALLSGCGASDTEETETESLLEPVALASTTVSVERKDVVDAEYLTGYVVPEVYSLSFEIDGTVDCCEISIGDTVEKYQELATLDEETLNEELAEIEAEYDELEQYYEGLNAIWEQETAKMQEQLSAADPNTVTAELLQLSIDERQVSHESELEQQQAELDAIQERYDEKNQDVTMNHLLSPCDGVVMDVMISVGDEVSADECVIIVGDYSNSYISCSTFYYESTIEKLAGMVGYVGSETIEVEYVAYTSDEVKAATESGEVDLPSRFVILSTDVELGVGDVAAIELINEVAEDVICVHKDALYSDSDGYYVYKDVNGAKQRVDVEIGMDSDMEVEITDGDLEEGDLVYVKE